MAAELDAISLLLANSSFLCRAKRCSCACTHGSSPSDGTPLKVCFTRLLCGKLTGAEAQAC